MGQCALEGWGRGRMPREGRRGRRLLNRVPPAHMIGKGVAAPANPSMRDVTVAHCACDRGVPLG